MAALYVLPSDAQRVASDAGLDLAHIPFDAKAINTWHNLLAVALRAGAWNILSIHSALNFPDRLKSDKI